VPSLTYFRTLTEYGAVSAEPSTSQAQGSPAAAAVDESRATGLDVRSLEWMRPLLGEYAYNFQKVSALYTGNPASEQAWTDAIARAQARRSTRRRKSQVGRGDWRSRRQLNTR